MKRNIGDNIEFENSVQMLDYYVDIYSAMFYGKQNRLTSKEKLHFIEHVVLFNQGKNLVSKQTLNYLNNKFTKTNTDRAVWIYRQKLKKKGWLIQTPLGLTIPPAFQGSYNELSVNLNIKHK